MNNNAIICIHCNTEVDTETMQQVCSNCFACTGCKRFICTHCGEVIVIKPLGKMAARTKQ